MPESSSVAEQVIGTQFFPSPLYCPNHKMCCCIPAIILWDQDLIHYLEAENRQTVQKCSKKSMDYC